MFVDLFHETGYFPYRWYRENILFVKNELFKNTAKSRMDDMQAAEPQFNVKFPLAYNLIPDLDKLLSTAYVACVGVMGGEPFVYPDLLDFIERYSKSANKKNIGFTQIVTNGTIVPHVRYFSGKFEKFRSLWQAVYYNRC